MMAETAWVQEVPEYVLLHNASDRTWSVLLIDDARAAVHSTHATELSTRTKGISQ
jgi:hypothetical protein